MCFRLYNTSEGLTVSCKHGPSECLGNRQQLWFIHFPTITYKSFQKYHPKQILAFISCLNRTPSQIGNSLSYTLHCADRAGVKDYASVIQPCADTSEGQNLLTECAQRCDALNTHVSATIRISGKNICKRDDGEWKDCKEPLSQGGGNVALGLQTIIEKEWKRTQSKGVYNGIRARLMIVILAIGQVLIGFISGMHCEFILFAFCNGIYG